MELRGRRNPPSEGDLVVVTWADAWSDDEDDPRKWREDCLVETAGWVVQTGAVWRIAAETGPVSGNRGVTNIPREMVRGWRSCT